MKKVLAFLLVVSVVLSMGVTALAAGSPKPPQPKVNVPAGLGIYNEDGKRIAAVPAKDVLKLNVGGADKLDAADKDKFLAAYEEAKNTEGKTVRHFFWLDVPEEYKTMDGFAYAKYYFGSRGQNITVTVNGNPMEVVKLGHGAYYAKLTEFGVVSIVSD